MGTLPIAFLFNADFMNVNMILLGVSLLVSHYVAAFTPRWLAPMLDDSYPVWTLTMLQQSDEVYDCGLEDENREFCTDIVKYYNTEIEGRLLVIDGLVKKIETTTVFSTSTYSELQKNLRKDGFSLSKAMISGQKFDVLKQLECKTIDEVNRDFVRFLSASRITDKRTFEWRPKTDYHSGEPSRWVQFSSDGKQITLRFIRK